MYQNALQWKSAFPQENAKTAEGVSRQLSVYKLGLFGEAEGQFCLPQNLSKLVHFQWPTQTVIDQLSLTCPDVKVKSFELFRSEDELDLEGIKVTLTNGEESPHVLGTSASSG